MTIAESHPTWQTVTGLARNRTAEFKAIGRARQFAVPSTSARSTVSSYEQIPVVRRTK
jgi:hypothetical protein